MLPASRAGRWDAGFVLCTVNVAGACQCQSLVQFGNSCFCLWVRVPVSRKACSFFRFFFPELASRLPWTVSTDTVRWEDAEV